MGNCQTQTTKLKTKMLAEIAQLAFFILINLARDIQLL